MKNQEGLVSVIVPVYNAEMFLRETIETILNQTYKKYELILVDDCSTDNSVNIINKYKEKDKRIKLIKNQKNSGAAVTRNNGIKKAVGQYISFIDADDKWEPTKLERQIKFMKENNCEFSFTSYQFADEFCNLIDKKVIVPSTITYKQALKNTTIWTSTVMLDMAKLKKEDIYMPNLKRGQDTATWWKILKKIDKAYGIKDVFSYYRRTNSSLSANKLTALKRTWNLYRNIEKFNIIKSTYYFVFYVLNAVRRRV